MNIKLFGKKTGWYQYIILYYMTKMEGNKLIKYSTHDRIKKTAL